MRILAIADQESSYLWDHFEKSKLEGIDLIISCGDLNPNYLSFLATFTSAPVLYVHGNHDERYNQTPPEGCICIEDKIYVHQGIRILGLGGSMRYKPGECQYTERQMKARVNKLKLQLLRRRGFDILVTHAPAYQLNDGWIFPTRGFGRSLRFWIDTGRSFSCTAMSICLMEDGISAMINIRIRMSSMYMKDAYLIMRMRSRVSIFGKK